MADENKTTPTYDSFCDLVKTELKYFAEAHEVDMTKNDLQIMTDNVCDLVGGPLVQLLENAVENEFVSNGFLDEDDGDDPDPAAEDDDGIIDADFSEHDDDDREAA